jgi:hypothetical protein
MLAGTYSVASTAAGQFMVTWTHPTATASNQAVRTGWEVRIRNQFFSKQIGCNISSCALFFESEVQVVATCCAILLGVCIMLLTPITFWVIGFRPRQDHRRRWLKGPLLSLHTKQEGTAVPCMTSSYLQGPPSGGLLYMWPHLLRLVSGVLKVVAVERVGMHS